MGSVVSALKKTLPVGLKQDLRALRSSLNLIPNYFYDLGRFAQSSTALRPSKSREQLASHLTMDYHRLEKGMALPAPRAGFGLDPATRLVNNLLRYERRYGADELTAVTRNVLKAYFKFNGDASPALTALARKFADAPAPAGLPLVEAGGVTNVSKAQLYGFDSKEMQGFLLGRSSIRQYTGEPLAADVIRDAVRIAMKAPSVCNRQCARVYVTTDKARIAEVLKYQNGNRGFGDTLGAIFVVAADNRAFTSLGERNQGWVDGGIFAMALAQALHALKVGSCMLNWSVEAGHDRKARRALGIDEHHSIITMIGAGVTVDQLTVATSARRDVDGIINWL